MVLGFHKFLPSSSFLVDTYGLGVLQCWVPEIDIVFFLASFPLLTVPQRGPCIPHVSQGRRQFSCSALPFLTSHLSIYSGHQPLMDTSPSWASLEAFFKIKWVWGFPGGSVVKNLPANAGDAGDVCSIPEWGRSPGGGNGNPHQYSYLGNPMDRGATVHRVTKT